MVNIGEITAGLQAADKIHSEHVQPRITAARETALEIGHTKDGALTQKAQEALSALFAGLRQKADTYGLQCNASVRAADEANSAYSKAVGPQSPMVAAYADLSSGQQYMAARSAEMHDWIDNLESTVCAALRTGLQQISEVGSLADSDGAHTIEQSNNLIAISQEYVQRIGGKQ